MSNFEFEEKYTYKSNQFNSNASQAVSRFGNFLVSKRVVKNLAQANLLMLVASIVVFFLAIFLMYRTYAPYNGEIIDSNGKPISAQELQRRRDLMNVK